MKQLIDCLKKEQVLSKEEFKILIEQRDADTAEYLFQSAREVREAVYGREVYIRGLIEFTNYCRNDCYYCGIRRSNGKADRYRLTKEQILDCCTSGYEMGFRTFVLQGGEDGHYREEDICDLVRQIKKSFPDCALTLSIGERSYEAYLAFYEAGADRYLLRHETADEAHYGKLHPADLSSLQRKQCLYDLKRIGYQTGTGFMVGSPYQTTENLVEDLLFIRELQPEMVGIGPFIAHHDTPFGREANGSAELTVYLLAVLRLMLPMALLPATTALGTIDKDGREKGILAGANVIMPNLSPLEVRKKYLLYDNKISTGDEAAEAKKSLEQRMERIGYRLVTSRGDCKTNANKPQSAGLTQDDKGEKNNV